MPSTYVTHYGLDFDRDVDRVSADLMFYKKHREEPFRSANPLNPVGEHLLRASRELFTRDEWNTDSKWTQETVMAFADHRELHLTGCASCSKSYDAGVILYLWYLTDPLDTVVLMASTSKIALAERTFASVVKAHGILRRHPKFAVPLKLNRVAMSITMEGDDDIDSSEKTALRGVAVDAGSTQDARGSLQGRHSKYTCVCCDEIAAMKDTSARAVLEAVSNLSIGALEFRLVTLSNLDSWRSVAGELLMPEAGLDSISVDSERWTTRAGGLVLHRDGYKSPALDEPEKFPFLINRAQIEANIKRFGENSATHWTMSRGFPVADGIAQGVISEVELKAFKALEPAEPFLDAPFVVAGLDPAYGGGDSCFFQPARVGRSKTGDLVLEFMEPRVVPISAVGDTPVTYQIVTAVRNLMAACGIAPGDIAVDSSGNQNVADVMTREFGAAPVRVNSATRATHLPIDELGTPSGDRCADAGAESYLLCANLIRAGHIRNMPRAAADQLAARRFKDSKFPLRLEDKASYKARVGDGSPDSMDSAALCCVAARARLGLTPGARFLARDPSPLRAPRPLSRGYSESGCEKFSNYAVDNRG